MISDGDRLTRAYSLSVSISQAPVLVIKIYLECK